ncbi:MAG: hypothetical protein PHI83_00580 [Sphaerochaetaceae bacterium]|jgi:hypothetical protein|nr:hypothetical protein [Sphaerochaetaceae bacterium]
METTKASSSSLKRGKSQDTQAKDGDWTTMKKALLMREEPFDLKALRLADEMVYCP